LKKIQKDEKIQDSQLLVVQQFIEHYSIPLMLLRQQQKHLVSFLNLKENLD